MDTLEMTGAGAADEKTVVYDRSVSDEEAVESYNETTAAAVTEAKIVSEDEGMNYFTFRQNSRTYTDNSGRELLIESLTDPDFFSNDPVRSDWVNDTINAIYEADAAFGEDLLSFAKSDIAGAGESDFYAYTHHVTMGIARHDSRVASLLTLSSSYSGGTHPNSSQIAYNLDLTSLRVLRLEDVIRESAAVELAALVQAKVESRFTSLGENTLFDDYAQTITKALRYGNMTAYWYFTEEGLTVFFNQYELGPYASGIIKAEVSYEQLEGILQLEFYPPEHTGTILDVQQEQSAGEDDWIYYVDLSDGETVYVTVDGRAEHVQFSEVFWAGSTIVGESMLFSANQVEDGAALAVTGDFSDPAKIYALEYYDANGGPYVLYVHESEVYSQLPVIE